MNVISTLATFYKEGGPFMHFVFVIAMLINAILVERFIVLTKAMRVNGRKLADQLVQAVQRGDLNGARHMVANGSTPVEKVAEAMLVAAPADEETLQAAADDASTLAMPELTTRLSYLGMLANSATLIGLLGTITGLITAISGVAVADAAARSASLSAGISEALHTTAFGLVVAIPTLLVQGWLSSRVDGVAESMDHLAIRLGKALARRSAPQGVVTTAPAHAHAPAHAQPVAMPRPAQVAPAMPRAAAGGAHGVQ